MLELTADEFELILESLKELRDSPDATVAEADIDTLVEKVKAAQIGGQPKVPT